MELLDGNMAHVHRHFIFGGFTKITWRTFKSGKPLGAGSGLAHQVDSITHLLDMSLIEQQQQRTSTKNGYLGRCGSGAWLYDTL